MRKTETRRTRRLGLWQYTKSDSKRLKPGRILVWFWVIIFIITAFVALPYMGGIALTINALISLKPSESELANFKAAQVPADGKKATDDVKSVIKMFALDNKEIAASSFRDVCYLDPVSGGG